MARVQQFPAVAAGLGASQRLRKNQKYVYTEFNDPCVLGDGIGGAFGYTDTNVSTVQVGPYGFLVRYEQTNAGAVGPYTTADGLLIPVDAASADGFEINLGRTITSSDSTVNTKSRGAFTIGTDESFFLKVKLDVVDVSDTSELAVGFSVGTWDATCSAEGYGDFAAIVVDGGALELINDVNNGGPSTTDSTQTQTDNDQFELEVRVSNSGWVRYFINGAVPTTDDTGFQFDTGDVVHAFVSMLTDAAGDPTVSLMSWESGYISSRGLENIADLVENPKF